LDPSHWTGEDAVFSLNWMDGMETVGVAEAHGFEDGGGSLLFYRVTGDDVLDCLTECSSTSVTTVKVPKVRAGLSRREGSKLPVLGGNEHPVATTKAASKQGQRQPLLFLYPCQTIFLGERCCCPFNAPVGDYVGLVSRPFNVPVGRLCWQREWVLQRQCGKRLCWDGSASQ
jgi:hypothetical protein